MQCSFCKDGGIIEKERKWTLSNNISYHYKCRQCGLDNKELADEFVYPFDRRSDLCTYYSPVAELDSSRYTVGQVLEVETRGGKRQVEVVHIHKGRIVTDDVTGKRKKRRILINEEIIRDSYDCLFPSNKRIYGGWWNRKVKII